MSACKHCMENAVEKMDSGEMVCTSCGAVIDDYSIGPPSQFNEGKFVSANCSMPIFENQNVQAARSINNSYSSSFTCKHCLQLIRKLASDFKLSNDQCEEAIALFKKVYPKYKQKQLHFKSLLAASCFYATLKNLNISVTFAEYSRIIGCNAGQLSGIFNDIKSEILQNQNAISVEEQIRSVLKDFPHNTLEERLELSNLVTKTANILNFATKCWLVTGRSTRICIMACSYFAWKSSSSTRHKQKYSDFRKLAQFSGCQQAVTERIKELTDVFIKFGNRLPYVIRTVDKYNVFSYINDIIEFDEEILLNQSQETEEQKYKEHRKNFSKKRKSYSDDDCEAIATNSASISDNDLIPDSDWNKYLRSADEVACLQAHEKKMKCIENS